MKLIVGLGNPDKKYERTRHNVGFLTLELLQFELNAPEFKLDKKFQAEVSQFHRGHEKLLLAKPHTYMNASGQAISALADYFKISPTDVWVVYDDIDLSVGTIRIGKFESAGGHKGIQSIIDNLDSNDFVRFRIGIKNEKAARLASRSKRDKQPADLPAIGLRRRRMQAGKFVLKKFGRSEKTIINDSLQRTVEAIKMALGAPLETVMNEYN